MAAFPINDKQDSSQYSETSEDVAIREKTEGGYVYSRPKFTRTARKTFTSGFSDLNNTDKLLVQAFWDTVKGGSDIFTWINPITSAVHNVRFTKKFTFEYIGRGNVHRWNVSGIELEEA